MENIKLNIVNARSAAFLKKLLQCLPGYGKMDEQRQLVYFMAEMKARHEALLAKYEVTSWYDEKNGLYRAWVKPKDSNDRKAVKRKTEEGLWERIFDICEDFEEASVKADPTLFELYTARQEYRVKVGEIVLSTSYRNTKTWELKMSELTNRKISSMEMEDWVNFYREAIAKFSMNTEWASRVRKNMELVIREARSQKLIQYSWGDVIDCIADYGIRAKKTACKKQTEAYTLDEQERFKNLLLSKLNSTSVHSNAAEAALLIFISGLRSGEVVALQGEDIEEDRIIVRKTEIKYKGKDGKTVYALKPAPKTDAGFRSVPIPEKWQWFTRRIKARLADDEFFCKGHGGMRMHTDTLRSACHAYGREAGIQKTSGAHKIRRTYISDLKHGGVDEALITSWAGHALPETTSEYYIRNVSSKQEQMEKLNRAII